jgi:hypothetical protein
MEGAIHYFGCKMERLEEHMVKYLQTPHENKLYVESCRVFSNGTERASHQIQ